MATPQERFKAGHPVGRAFFSLRWVDPALILLLLWFFTSLLIAFVQRGPAWVKIVLMAAPLLGFLVVCQASLLRPLAFMFSKRHHELEIVLEHLLEDIVLLKNTSKVTANLARILLQVLHIDQVIVITRKVEKSSFSLWHRDGSLTEAPENLRPVFAWMERHPELLSVSQIGANPDGAEWPEMLRAAFATLEAVLLMPLVLGENFVGLISLGPKRQGRYTDLEIQFLNRVKPIAAIALNNAYLYSSIGALSRELWEANKNLDTKVRERTQALEEALARMREYNVEQSNFFAMASHNLGTPLTSVKAGILLLFKKQQIEDKELEGIIHNNLIRLEVLLHDILEISLIESNKLNLYFEPVDICQLIEDTYRKVLDLFPQKQVDWELRKEPVLGSLRADKLRLRTVLFHLMANAFKFSGSRLRLCLTLQNAWPDRLRQYVDLPARLNGQEPVFMECVVQDNGEGIAEEEIPKIFNKFHQANPQKRYQGKGLGLHLVKKIIEYHGGAIRVESRLLHGSAFSFVLPLQPEKLRRPEYRPPAADGCPENL